MNPGAEVEEVIHPAWSTDLLSGVRLGRRSIPCFDRPGGNLAEQIVDLDIEVDGELTVTEAHAIAQRTEQAIKDAVGNVYDVLVHVEPVGNVENRERYGVSRRKLDREGSL